MMEMAFCTGRFLYFCSTTKGAYYCSKEVSKNDYGQDIGLTAAAVTRGEVSRYRLLPCGV
jgi:hypothetical protein